VADRKKLVLAYSGGLDTSVAIRWIKEQYNLDVITLVELPDPFHNGRHARLVEDK